MNTLKIGLAQAKQTDDFDVNAEAILRFVEDAVRREEYAPAVES